MGEEEKKEEKKKAGITQLQVLTINNTHHAQKEVKNRKRQISERWHTQTHQEL